jgi:hypothetical protein
VNSPSVAPKVDPDVFEPELARQDFIPACILVAKENLLPFMNGLYVEYQKLEEEAKKAPVAEKKAVAKPKEVLEFEKKNSGKKRVRYKDGSTGG